MLLRFTLFPSERQDIFILKWKVSPSYYCIYVIFDIYLYLFCFSEPFIIGGQPNDDRIYVENRVERAPDYTEGEQE